MGMHRGGRWHHARDEDEEYQRQTSDRELAVRLLRYTLRFKNKMLLLSLIVFATTILGLVPPYLLSLAIDIYIANYDSTGLTLLAIVFVAVGLVTFGVEYSHRYLISWLGARFEFDMRIDVFRHLQKLSPGYYAKKEVGSIVSRVTNDIDKIMELVSSGVIEIIADVVTLVGIVFIMLWMSLRLSLITFSVIPMIFAFMYLWGKRVRRVYRETRKTIASVSAKIEESVSGMKEIQSFSREGETKREFEETNVSNLQANVEAGRIMSAFMPAVSFFSAIGNFLVLWFGGLSVMQGALTVGVLFAFMSYINRFFWPIHSLSNFWNQVQSAMAAAERVFQIIDIDPEILEKPGAIILPFIEGSITFEKMTFSYEDDVIVLSDINLNIEPNTTIALVGPTGAGKTTMINLLYRFYDPQVGSIKVDGHDLREVDLKSLRHQMAIVLQDPFLFSGTVKENIKYGRPESSDEKVVEVAKAVGAHEFILSLPEGYETDVRERGGRLSMGQRQLVSLARALIADPRILILDEATSSVDAYTELLIKQALERVLRDRTSIVIAHRLSTVRNADRIVVLDKGRIVEIGKHEELIEMEGLYRKLYDMQFKYEESGEAEMEAAQQEVRVEPRATNN